MLPLNSLQMRETADGQPVFVLLAEVHHSINTLRQDFSGLHYHRLITWLQLLIWSVRVRWLRVQ